MKLNLNSMFGNKPKEAPTPVEEVRTPVRTVAPPQEKILTLISEGCKFEGNLSSPTTTRIDGHVVGNLRGESGIIIGEKGTVEGNIHAVDIVISGTVKGNIKAHKLELRRSGALEGDIVVEELLTEPGAKFNGVAKMGEISSKSNIIDMKDAEIEIQAESKPKDKPVLKFH